jgi:signal transduction histidine kinase
MLARQVRGSLGAKLLLAQMLVVIAGSVTLAAVAFAVAPGVFHTHVRMALGVVPPETARHLDEGLAKAITVALATGTGVAVATALGVSFLLARRITIPIRSLAQAAGRIAGGRYTARVPEPAGSDELAELAAAFNTMAEALEASEQRRSELLADLAHELRTPLATIDGYLEGVADGVITPDDAILPVLRSETARLRRLVDDLNAVSRAEERQLDLHPVRCDPDKLLETAVQAAQAAYAAKQVTLMTRIDPRLPRLMVDPDRIGEVLANLLGNALRHTPSGGSVEVSATTPRAATYR